MGKLKGLSAQITEMLDKILPDEMCCAIVLIDLKEKEVSTVSNLSDESIIVLLEKAAEAMRTPEEVDDLKMN
jgi:hypothetical protein